MRVDPDTRPTRDELPDELDAPRAPRTVKRGGWTYPAHACRAPACERVVARYGDMCESCRETYNAQR